MVVAVVVSIIYLKTAAVAFGGSKSSKYYISMPYFPPLSPPPLDPHHVYLRQRSSLIGTNTEICQYTLPYLPITLTSSSLRSLQTNLPHTHSASRTAYVHVTEHNISHHIRRCVRSERELIYITPYRYYIVLCNRLEELPLTKRLLDQWVDAFFSLPIFDSDGCGLTSSCISPDYPGGRSSRRRRKMKKRRLRLLGSCRGLMSW